jgi:hypothetical protein
VEEEALGETLTLAWRNAIAMAVRATPASGDPQRVHGGRPAAAVSVPSDESASELRDLGTPLIEIQRFLGTRT